MDSKGRRTGDTHGLGARFAEPRLATTKKVVLPHKDEKLFAGDEGSGSL
jgi:hypothetical protein